MNKTDVHLIEMHVRFLCTYINRVYMMSLIFIREESLSVCLMKNKYVFT